jgi:hypothetical protein
MSAVLFRSTVLGVVAFIVAFLPVSVSAQTSSGGDPTTPARADEHPLRDTVEFLAGSAIGLGMHEGGHLLFDAMFDARPGLSGVHFGPIPFFAITHRNNLTPRREFTISSAGFWVQEVSNEWLLTRRPVLRRRHAPLAKGLFAFNVLNSVGYAFVAFARAGPAERDTRGMAASALLDAYRYFRPDARWAKWGSRSAKVGSVLLVLKRR